MLEEFLHGFFSTLERRHHCPHFTDGEIGLREARPHANCLTLGHVHSLMVKDMILCGTGKGNWVVHKLLKNYDVFCSQNSVSLAGQITPIRQCS